MLYDKPVICYQLSYFMLAGIVRIRVCGEEEELSRIKRLFGQGERFGLELVYGASDERRTSCRTMRVSGLSFLYGKDLTKTMRRILYGSAEQVRLTDDEKRGLGITFVRRPADMWQDVCRSNAAPSRSPSRIMKHCSRHLMSPQPSPG